MVFGSENHTYELGVVGNSYNFALAALGVPLSHTLKELASQRIISFGKCDTVPQSQWV
jgi:hypothetical protein